MHYPHIKQKVKLLRESGKSLKDISMNLGISKSTVSFWCRDMVLSENTIKKIERDGKNKSLAGLLRYSELKRSKRNFNVKNHNDSFIRTGL